jgi:hypothetical protein
MVVNPLEDIVAILKGRPHVMLARLACIIERYISIPHEDTLTPNQFAPIKHDL